MCHVQKVLKASDDWLPIRHGVCVYRELRGGGQETRAELMRKTAVFLLVLPTNQVSQFRVPLQQDSQQSSVVSSVETVGQGGRQTQCKHCQLSPGGQRFYHAAKGREGALGILLSKSWFIPCWSVYKRALQLIGCTINSITLHSEPPSCLYVRCGLLFFEQETFKFI